MFRYAFSTRTIDESTITPIASTIPPSDMILDVIPKTYIRMKLRRMDNGSSMRIRTMERKCSRNTVTTRATMMLASISARFNVTDRGLDQRRAIVRSSDVNAGWKPGLDFLDALF